MANAIPPVINNSFQDLRCSLAYNPDLVGGYMNTVIYKSLKKQDSYLYIEQEDDFSRVPEVLMKALGRLEKAMSLDLSSQKKLARADIKQVISALEEEGFYLQMPDESERLALGGIKPVSNPIPKL